METKQHWSVHVAPVHGALEEAEALASSYGIRLNSNRPLWQAKVVLYQYSGATGICQYPLLRAKGENNLAGSRSPRFYRGRIKLTVVDAEDLGEIHLFGGQCD